MEIAGGSAIGVIDGLDMGSIEFNKSKSTPFTVLNVEKQSPGSVVANSRSRVLLSQEANRYWAF